MSLESSRSPHTTSDPESGPSTVIAEHAEIDKSPTSSHEADLDHKPKSRASRACSSCNRQKLRCDGGKPCTRCTTNQISEGCEYLPSLRGKTRKRKIRPAEKAESPPRKAIKAESPPREVETPIKKREALPAIFGSQLAYWKNDSVNRQTPLPGVRSLNRLISARNDAVDHPSNRPTWKLPPISPRVSNDLHPQQPALSILSSLSTIRDAPSSNPLAVLAEASMGSHAFRSNPVSREGSHGPAAHETREPNGQAPSQVQPSTVSSTGIFGSINTQLAEQLFAVYFRILHPHYPFLDPQHCRPQAVFKRSEFLFNAICVVSARATDASLWAKLKGFAIAEMQRLPSDSTIDTVQGHLIYAIWNPIGGSQSKDDTAWPRAGVAVRTAIDIGLDKVVYDKEAVETLPRWALRSITRTWLLAEKLDRTLSIQLDRPHVFRSDSDEAYRRVLLETRQPAAIEDVWTVALGEWGHLFSRAVTRLHAEIRDLQSINAPLGTRAKSHPDLIPVIDGQFRNWVVRTTERLREAGGDERSTRLISANIRLYDHYARLVIFSHGLQRAEEFFPLDLPPAFAQFQSAAIRLISNYEADYDKTAYIHGVPDFHHNVLTYAAVSILKVTEARYNHLDSHRPTILTLVRKAADVLSRSARSNDQLPASLAAFIKHLLEAKDGTTSSAQSLFPRPINMSHFGVTLDSDPSVTLWPPSSASGRIVGLGGTASYTPGENKTGGGQDEKEVAKLYVPKTALSLGVGTFGLEDRNWSSHAGL